METSNFNNNTLEFRQIILTHLKEILRVSLLHINMDNKHALYVESIKTLSDVLIPFFDERMSKAYDTYETKYIELMGNRDKLILDGKLNKYFSDGYIRPRSKELHRELFRELNLLLKRNDYLKTAMFGEGAEKDDDIIEDKGEE